MASNGVTSSNIFSFYFTGPGELSFVDLGSPIANNKLAGATTKEVSVIE